jgi:uncharacterized protein (UPF0548 family)
VYDRFMADRISAGRQAAIGAAIWLTWVPLVQPSWTACLLLLSPLVLVPLALGLANRPDGGPTAPSLDRLRLATTPSAAIAALSFIPEPGLSAGLLTVPWLGLGVAVGTVGVGRFLSRRTLHPTVGVDAALAFLTVGAGWLTISRAGGNPLGFSDAIVQLTAVHFHYAGLALPVVAALAAQRSGRSSTVPIWVSVAVPLTAIGITIGGTVEWVAATVMALGGFATAWKLTRMRPLTAGVARALLTIAALSLSAGMALALGWAWSRQFDWSYLNLDEMARWHGTLNAIGFGFAGLTGLYLTKPVTDQPADTIALHLGSASQPILSTLAAAAKEHDPTSPVGLLHRPTPPGYRRDEWSGPLPNGFDAGRHAIEHWIGHRAAGLTLAEPPPPISWGETVALAIPVGPISVSATARIIDVIDEPDHYGFIYATLPHHPEDGEESFIVQRLPDDTARYTITAVWRTATFASRLLPPLTRYLQRKTIGRYLTGIADWNPERSEVAR